MFRAGSWILHSNASHFPPPYPFAPVVGTTRRPAARPKGGRGQGRRSDRREKPWSRRWWGGGGWGGRSGWLGSQKGCVTCQCLAVHFCNSGRGGGHTRLRATPIVTVTALTPPGPPHPSPKAPRNPHRLPVGQAWPPLPTPSLDSHPFSRASRPAGSAPFALNSPAALARPALGAVADAGVRVAAVAAAVGVGLVGYGLGDGELGGCPGVARSHGWLFGRVDACPVQGEVKKRKWKGGSRPERRRQIFDYWKGGPDRLLAAAPGLFGGGATPPVGGGPRGRLAAP